MPAALTDLRLVITVPDLGVAVAFYRDRLGFTPGATFGEPRALLAPFGVLEHPAPRIVLVLVEFAYFVWAACVVFERGVIATAWRMVIARLVLVVATVVFAAIGAIAILAITQPELLSGP